MAEVSASLEDLIADSPHHIPVFLLPQKPEQSRRLAVDYCKLNQVKALVAAVIFIRVD